MRYHASSGYELLGGWPIELAPPVTLSGRVLGPDGKPLAKAPLSIDTWVRTPQKTCSTTNYRETITDSQGRFSMTRLPPGSHVLYYPSHAPRSIPVQGLCGALVVEPTDGQQLTGLVLDLSRSTAAVEGWVFGPDGEPIAGASVLLGRFHKWKGMSGSAGPNLSSPKTDAQGYYKITGIAPGQWQIHPFHPRYQRPSICHVVTFARQDGPPRPSRHRALRDRQHLQLGSIVAERTDDLRKLDNSTFSYGSLPPVRRNLASFGQLTFFSLSPGQIDASSVQIVSLGLPATATPEEIAREAHVGELYFEPPDHLVTINGTIIAPFSPPPGHRNGSDFVDWIRQMTRAELVEQVEASRQRNPDVDGRRIAVRKGENYLVVRSDFQGYLMRIDNVDEQGIACTCFYLGHLRLSPRAGTGPVPATVSMSAAEFGKLPAAEQRALLVRVFQRRLQHSKNLYYETEQSYKNYTNRNGEPGELLKQDMGNRWQFRHWRLGDSFRMDIDWFEKPTDAKPSHRSSCALNADEGVARNASPSRDGKQPPHGQVQYPFDASSSNPYVYWFDHMDPTADRALGDYLFPYLIRHQDQFDIKAPIAGDKVQLTVPWQPSWAKKPGGKREYLLDPQKGFLPIRCQSRWDDVTSPGKPQWRVESFVVHESRLVGDVWMPTKLTDETIVSHMPNFISVCEVKVPRIESGDVEPSDLFVPFTEGMQVQDTIEGVTYVADAQGNATQVKFAPNWKHEPPEWWLKRRAAMTAAEGIPSMASRISPADRKRLEAERKAFREKNEQQQHTIEAALKVMRSPARLEDRVEAGLKVLRIYTLAAATRDCGPRSSAS